jgi:hypothetical protein
MFQHVNIMHLRRRRLLAEHNVQTLFDLINVCFNYGCFVPDWTYQGQPTKGSLPLLLHHPDRQETNYIQNTAIE